jgi:signal transduction histidine kinase
MSIRLKLLLSYAAMLLVPLVLLILTSLLLVVVYRGDVQHLRSIYETKVDSDEEAFHRVIKHTIERTPSLLDDPTYLTELSDEMISKDTYLAVRTGNQWFYLSDGIRDKLDLIKQLPAYKYAGSYDEETTPTRSYGNELYGITQFDYTMNNGQPATLFMVHKIDPLVFFVRKFFPILFISLIIILIFTHSILTYMMSKNIIRPLRELHNATRRIKEGDLNFQVKVEGKDEIGQLGIAFEEMRSQLAQSILLQLQYEENRKELISNISHDLKTPITAIKGYVEGILDGVAESQEKKDKYIQTISRKAEEMDHLIDELFLYSKLDLKRVSFTFETIPISAFLSDWVEDLRFDLNKNGIDLVTDIRLGKDIKVLVDRDKFKRVLYNVIQNSIKYMDKEYKQIHLFALSEDAEVRLEIQDNGQGIDDEALPFIFDRFYRAEQSRNTNTGGSGLGLAIAKQIMDGHSGRIEAVSEKEIGTRIVLFLPIMKEGKGAI